MLIDSHTHTQFKSQVVSVEDKSITICEDPDDPETYGGHTFTFDHVYDQNSDATDRVREHGKGWVESSLKGYNATIFNMVKRVRERRTRWRIQLEESERYHTSSDRAGIRTRELEHHNAQTIFGSVSRIFRSTTNVSVIC